MNEYRPVWLTASFFDIHDDVEADQALKWLWEQYNEAPDDPVEVVMQALNVEDKFYVYVWQTKTLRALNALGMPRPKELDVPEST